NLAEIFHACFSAVKLANYFAIRHESCRANPKRKESLAELIQSKNNDTNCTMIDVEPSLHVFQSGYVLQNPLHNQVICRTLIKS
ncbi:MAG: hypothetical protein LBT37_01680, partial [Lactobacillaceae bacterium]|nr:hypothetical protein [Lactobacillaceae bacterium]